MKLRHLITLAGLAYATYEIIAHRDEIKENVTGTKESVHRINDEVDNIKLDLSIISDQLQSISKMGNDFSHKLRYFQKDMEAHLNEIKVSTEHMKKS